MSSYFRGIINKAAKYCPPEVLEQAKHKREIWKHKINGTYTNLRLFQVTADLEALDRVIQSVKDKSIPFSIKDLSLSPLVKSLKSLERNSSAADEIRGLYQRASALATEVIELMNQRVSLVREGKIKFNIVDFNFGDFTYNIERLQNESLLKSLKQTLGVIEEFKRNPPQLVIPALPESEPVVIQPVDVDSDVQSINSMLCRLNNERNMLWVKRQTAQLDAHEETKLKTLEMVMGHLKRVVVLLKSDIPNIPNDPIEAARLRFRLKQDEFNRFYENPKRFDSNIEIFDFNRELKIVLRDLSCTIQSLANKISVCLNNISLYEGLKESPQNEDSLKSELQALNLSLRSIEEEHGLQLAELNESQPKFNKTGGDWSRNPEFKSKLTEFNVAFRDRFSSVRQKIRDVTAKCQEAEAKKANLESNQLQLRDLLESLKNAHEPLNSAFNALAAMDAQG